MAIKIIEKGKKKGRCPVCGCVFEYESDDIQRGINISGSFFNREIGYYLYVNCPDCGNVLKIATSE